MNSSHLFLSARMTKEPYIHYSQIYLCHKMLFITDLAEFKKHKTIAKTWVEEDVVEFM